MAHTIWRHYNKNYTNIGLCIRILEIKLISIYCLLCMYIHKDAAIFMKTKYLIRLTLT